MKKLRNLKERNLLNLYLAHRSTGNRILFVAATLATFAAALVLKLDLTILGVLYLGLFLKK